jgi:formiminoglutamate deiminase
MIQVPSFANCHSHAFHRALRGRKPRGTDFWGWRDGMYAIAGVLDPGSYFRLARATFAEMRLAGFSSVGEFHYLHLDSVGRPYANPNAMAEAVIEAAREVGLRICLLHTRYARAGFPASGVGTPGELDPVQRRFVDADLLTWQQRTTELASRYAADPLVVIGTAIHSVRGVPAEEFSAIAETLAQAPLHVHVSEQPAENAACLAATGMTPVQLLAEAGVWSPRATAVHATHLTEQDIVILGRTGTNVCFCPTTEAELADGIGPSIALSEAGARITLGSDSNTVIDPFVEARSLAMNERLASGRRDGWAAAQLWAAATTDGHASLGFGPPTQIPDHVEGSAGLANLNQLELLGLRTTVQTAGVEDPIWAASAASVLGPLELDPVEIAADLTAVIEELWSRL